MAQIPNTFGTEATRCDLIDPRHVRRLRQRFGRDPEPYLSLANSLCVPCGRRPARGWVLLTRKQLDLLADDSENDGSGLYRTDLTLALDGFDQQGATGLEFKNLAIVQSRCMTRGLESSPDAVFLVELCDWRGVVGGRHFSAPTEAFYNVLSPAYPQQYYTASMNGAAAWSWSDMVHDLWDQLAGSFVGSFPGLPSTPTSVPTNWNLPGVPLLDAMCRALYHLGMTVSCDLTLDSPYGIVSMGADDTNFVTLTEKWSGRLQDDYEWVDVGSGRVPGSVIVYFRRVNEEYGTEETIRRDSLQWATTSLYSVTVAAPGTFAGAQGQAMLWDDFCVRFDTDGNAVVADVAAAAAIATERVSQYFDRIYSRTSGSMRRVYAGLLPFYAGSQVDGVRWAQDHRTGRAAWRTEIIRGRLWPEIYADDGD